MSPTDPDGLRVALLVLEVLDRLVVPYHLGGSYASSIHGIPRQTQDVDLVVDLPKDRVRGLVDRLSSSCRVRVLTRSPGVASLRGQAPQPHTLLESL